MKFLTSLNLLAFLPAFIYAQCPDQWQWQNPKPQSNSLHDVQVFGSDTAYAVGNAGTVLKTMNGGDYWFNQPIETENDLRGSHFLASDLGWVVGTSGTIIKTTNGRNWNRQNSGTTNNLESIYFINPDTGWVVGESGTTLVTADGGSNWSYEYAGIDIDLKKVQFKGPDTGWALGRASESAILKTYDGGQTWDSSHFPTSESIHDLCFINGQEGWVAGMNGAIYKTNDGGKTWIDQTNSNINGNLRSVHFLGPDTGRIVGDDGTLLETYDGGKNWDSKNLATSNDLSSVYFANNRASWAVGSHGTLFNLGTYWIDEVMGDRESWFSAYFLDSTTGWVTGRNEKVIKTTNGGRNWISGSSFNQYYVFYSIYFHDPNHGWAVGHNGRISYNDGSFWNAQTSPTSKRLTGVQFVNQETGWISGHEGTVLKSTNGGQDWNSQNSGTSKNLNSLFFLDNSEGWICGEDGTLLHTTNGGDDWNMQNSPAPGDLESVFFINSNEGWMCGDDGSLSFENDVILHTTDGGKNWEVQKENIASNLSDVHFVDNQNGWVVGGNGTILHTSDGGKTWVEQKSGTDQFLHSVHFTDPNTGWAVGLHGTVLKYQSADTEASFDFEKNDSVFQFTNESFNGHYQQWNFGDGKQSFQRNPEHHYNDTGHYEVCLKVENNCSKDSNCQKVTFCKETISNFDYASNGLKVDFQNRVSNAVDLGWDFGDGMTDSNKNPSHHFSEPGAYQVCLYTENFCSAESFCDSIKVCDTPSASFNYSINDLTVNFNNEVPDYAESWEWTFDKDTTIIEKNPEYTFDTSGEYEVCLAIEAPCGKDTSCQSIQVGSTGIPNQDTKSFLLKTFPNPVKEAIQFDYYLPERSKVLLEFYDLTGNKIETFNYGQQSTGQQSHTIDLSNYTPGMYYFIFQGGSYQKKGKFIYIGK